MRINSSERTDIGRRRSVNQDSCGTQPTPLGLLCVVCDGMGGHLAGEEASRLAVEAFTGDYETDDPAELLQQATIRANEQVFEAGHGSMGTTAVAGLFHRNTLYIANVGDSRAYLIRGGQIVQLSRDHSLVAEQVAAGFMTAEQARQSTQRNIITRALGNRPTVEADIYRVAVQPGDTLLLCSDGLHGLVEDEELAETINGWALDDATRMFIDLANERGGHDNITAVLARVEELDADVVSDADDPFAPTETDDTPAPAEAAVTAPAPAVTPPAPTATADSPERPLTRRGLVLALVVLVVLIGLAAAVLIGGPL